MLCCFTLLSRQEGGGGNYCGEENERKKVREKA